MSLAPSQKPVVAVLDDYQNVARSFADWSKVEQRAEIRVLNRHVPDEAALAGELSGCQVLCVMRERTPITATLLERLPDLKLIVTTGRRNASVDVAAAAARGIPVAGTDSPANVTAELAFTLILSLARHIPFEHATMKAGGWQTRIGRGLKGRTLGVVGLGRLGSQVAGFGRAFGMRVIAWSPNLDETRAAKGGAELVEKAELFSQADFISIHMVLSARSRNVVDAQAIGAMKKSAYLVNTSRAGLVDYAALADALGETRIAGAALDVYEEEPLPADHKLRGVDRLIMTPHVGYVTEETYEVFFTHTVEAIEAWLDGREPPRLLKVPGQ